VVITGAASGMGLLYARRAVAERARAVVLWDVNASALEHATAGLRSDATPGTTIFSYVVDLADPENIAVVAARVRAEVGIPDVLINNAGIVRGTYFSEHDSAKDTLPTMKVNALAPMLVTTEFLAGMIAEPARARRIVNIASAVGLFSNPRMSVYVASKWALLGWSDSLRLELAQQGIENVRVTTVAPSYISTGMFEGAKGPLLTPIMTPEFVVERVWAAMLAGKPLLILPWSVYVAKFFKGVLPLSLWDRMAGPVFGIYTSMSNFTGR
jgi:all-trans-retinol dehydrogenase (NAD+)